MPEGDTVRNDADALTTALAGQVVERSDFRVPALATVNLRGWTIVECAAAASICCCGWSSEAGTARTLHSHLRMDGTWRTFAPGERWHGRPAHTIRVVLTTDTTTAVGYHLHELTLLPTAEEPALLAHLGPDLLGSDWDADEAVRRLAAKPDREIADALLDQRNLAGIGNLYKSEALFLRGIWPWRPVTRGRRSARARHARAAAAGVERGPVDPGDDRFARAGARRTGCTAGPGARAAAAAR